jgi:glycosyltransferase involved in cell wall biosynthesis
MDRVSEYQSSVVTPGVSVVVPSYNHAPFVETTLRSILKQTVPPKELIVIDDGSSDDSPRIIERVLRDCSFPVEFVTRQNRGLCATLNEGLAKTSGDYFSYLGSDDLWLPDFLRERVQLLESRRDAVLAYGHTFFVDEENRVIDCTAHWANYADGDARQMLLRTIGPMSPTVLYRRSALEHEHWDESAKLEDYDLYLRLSEAGPFAFDPQVLSAWRRHSSNVSWDQSLMLDEQLKAQREAAVRFGMNQPEIEKLQKTTRFARAEDFMRVGNKSRALRLMLTNPGGAKSLRTAGRMLLRLLTPHSILRRRIRSQQQQAFERYGTIEI